MLINSGTYGIVYNMGNGTVMKKYKNTETGVAADMIREVAVLKSIINPHVIKILEIDYTIFTSISLPFYSHNLEESIKKKLPYNKKEIFHCICLGLYALHQKGLVHRDLKPSNIMLKNKNHALIIDTGFCKTFELDRDYGVKTPKVVTHYYRAPEIILRKNYSFEIDIWSLGCIFAEMYLNTYLFDTDNEISLLSAQCVLMGTPKYLSSDDSENISQNDKSSKEIKVFSYKGNYQEKFKKYGDYIVEIIGGMLDMNYETRYSISDVLNSDYFDSIIEYRDEAEEYEEYLDEYKVEFNMEKLNSDIVNMRAILLNWLLETIDGNYYNYKIVDNKKNGSIFFRSAIIFDRYLCNESINFINRENIQLIGLSCLLIASKYENSKNLDVDDMLYACNNIYSRRDLFDMEKRICRVIDMNIATPTLYNYICMYVHDLKLNKKQTKLFKKYLKICVLHATSYKWSFSILCIVCGYIALEEKLERDKKPLSLVPDKERDDIYLCQENILNWIAELQN